MLLLFGWTSRAQRHCDIKVVGLFDMSNVNISCTDSTTYGYIFINNGPDDIFDTDTFKIINPTIEAGFYSPGTIGHEGASVYHMGDTIRLRLAKRSFDQIFWLLDSATQARVEHPNFNNSTTYIWPYFFGGFVDTIEAIDPVDSNNFAGVYSHVQCNVTGIFSRSQDNEPLSIFPNPADNQVQFRYIFTRPSEVRVTVKDITGRSLITRDLGKQLIPGERRFSIDVSSLHEGMYFVELVMDNKRAVSKLMVRH